MGETLAEQKDQRAPRPLGPLNDHYWMVLRMARATGVDLVRAMREEDLAEQEWCDVVQGCRKCTWAAQCDKWLLQRGAPDIRGVPGACRNRRLFETLADHQKD